MQTLLLVELFQRLLQNQPECFGLQIQVETSLRPWIAAYC